MQKLKQIDEFPTLFYVPAWMKSSVETNVAFKELTFLQDIITYKNFAQTIAEKAFKKLANLECFLSKKTVVYTMFSDYSKLINKNKKLMEKVCRKHLAARSDEFRRGIPVVRAITIDQRSCN